METVKVKLTPASALLSNGIMVLRHQQVELAYNAGVIGQRRWINSDRTYAEFATRNENIEGVTAALRWTGNMLHEVVRVENVEELYSRRVRCNVQVNVYVAGNYQRRSVRCRAFE